MNDSPSHETQNQTSMSNKHDVCVSETSEAFMICRSPQRFDHTTGSSPHLSRILSVCSQQLCLFLLAGLSRTRVDVDKQRRSPLIGRISSILLSRRALLGDRGGSRNILYGLGLTPLCARVASPFFPLLCRSLSWTPLYHPLVYWYS